MTAAELDKLCKGFKGTKTDVKWGNDLCYTIGEKMYCVTSLKGPMTIGFKATPEDFSELTERDGIIPAPYVARYHWVLVEKVRALSPKEWKHYVGQAYTLVFEKLPGKIKAKL